MDVLDHAIRFAAEAHSGMTRKGTDVPYILHPMETAAIVGTMTADREILAAAVLHDVVEDTGHTIQEIREKFGDRVAGLVASESEDKRENLPAKDTWRIRKEETIAHLRLTRDPAVKMITLGDKLSNIRAISRDYAAIGDRLWARFNQKDKAEQGWYYVSIAGQLKELRDFPAWQEYNSLIRRVFSGTAESGPRNT